MSRKAKWAPGKPKITNFIAQSARRDVKNGATRKQIASKYDVSLSTAWWLKNPDILFVDESVRKHVAELRRQIEHVRLVADTISNQTTSLDLAEEMQRQIRHLVLSADTLEAQSDGLAQIFGEDEIPSNVTPIRREA